jgi:hypothetical protein
MVIGPLLEIASAQSTHQQDRLLPVPFVAQHESPCAVEAAVMVLRYWGAAHAKSDDVAGLIECTSQGLPPDALASALQRNGWNTQLSHGDGSSMARLRGEVENGYPVIVRLADQANVNRYAVVVAATSEDVVMQDPARGPYEVMVHSEFEREWMAAGRWMLTAALPSASGSADWAAPPVAEPEATPSRSIGSCADLIGTAIGRRESDLAAAVRGLRAATALCPDSPAAARELAALQFQDSKWNSAERYAHRAVDLDPKDRRAWNLLAQSRYFSGEVRAALRSWNEIQRPVVTDIEIHNSKRTDPQVIADLLGIEPGDLLTNDKFIRAVRRLQELPVSFDTRVKYSAREDGTAKVDVYIDERDVLPVGPIPITAVGVGGLAFQDLRFDIAGPTGGGEDVTFSWGWERNWRHLRLGLDVPSPGRLPGLASIEAFWEDQVYQPGIPTKFSTSRRRVAVAFSNWAKSWLWWKAGTGFDQFDLQKYASLDAAVQGRFVRDHLSIDGQFGSWFQSTRGRAFSTGAVWVSTRSTTRTERRIWLTVFGTAIATSAAPYQLWAGAGSSEAGNAYLRAHPLIDQGIVNGEVFGRRVDFASIEFDHPVHKSPGGPVALAVFVDAAQARYRTAGQPDTPLYLDAGIGFRMRPPNVEGVLRFDIARGLRDGRFRVSIGLMQQWPKR